jgi:mono/diheme cytochrome c family protein
MVCAPLDGYMSGVVGKIASKGKAMSQDKPQHHMMFGTLILWVLFVGLTLFVVSVVEANPGPDSAASSATFRTKCATCHGQDGGGSTVGKSMNVPDLRSPVVQKLSDTELAQIIANGKGGMPPFKSSLSEDQIHSMVSYVRSLHQKK